MKNYPKVIRTLGHLPCDRYSVFVLCNDGNVWLTTPGHHWVNQDTLEEFNKKVEQNRVRFTPERSK